MGNSYSIFRISRSNPRQSTDKMLQRALILTLFCSSIERIASTSARHSALVALATNGQAFQGKIHVNGNSHELNLKKPEFPVFAPHYRLTALQTGPHGRKFLKDVTPRHHPSEWESNIYEDPEANAVFRVENINGKLRLHGIIHNMHVSHDGKDHFAVIHNHTALENNSYMDSRKHSQQPSFMHENLDELAATRSTQDDSSIITPELYMTIDAKHWNDMNQDEDEVHDYLAIMVRAVNHRYKEITNPSIRFKIVGARILKDVTEQPFVEASRLPDKTCDMYKRGWKKSQVPGHDLAPLLIGEDVKGKDGLAHERGACKDANGHSSWRVSVIKDTGAWYSGVHTLAHELAHGLGSPEDEDKDTFYDGEEYDTSACLQTQGYIMSYKWGPNNRVSFSPCSVGLMKKFISLDKAACLKSNQSTSVWEEATYFPGELFSLDQQCQKLRGPTAQAASSRTPDELCAQLACQWTDSSGESVASWMGVRPYESTPCGKKGQKCVDAKCV